MEGKENIRNREKQKDGEERKQKGKEERARDK
jgi:hypothetical protein